MLPLCREEGIGVIPWSPLARGRLTRDWEATRPRSAPRRTSSAKSSTAPPRMRTARSIERVGTIAEARGIPRAQVALAWLLHKPAVTAPIIGASKPHHLEDAIAALSVKLSPEDMAQLEEPYVPHPVAGFS